MISHILSWVILNFFFSSRLNTGPVSRFWASLSTRKSNIIILNNSVFPVNSAAVNSQVFIYFRTVWPKIWNRCSGSHINSSLWLVSIDTNRYVFSIKSIKIRFDFENAAIYTHYPSFTVRIKTTLFFYKLNSFTTVLTYLLFTFLLTFTGHLLSEYFCKF